MFIVIGPTQIRVRNGSDVDFKDVKVNGKKYGDIKAGATTDYQVWEAAYKYAAVSLLAGSRSMAIHPIDYVGEGHLGPGYFTYVLTIKEDRLEIRAEKDTTASPPPGGRGATTVPSGGTAQTKTVALGQTMAEVEAILGKPETIVNLGTKVIYNYKGMKVIFVDGKVSDVQ
jgi:hypothetical protein